MGASRRPVRARRDPDTGTPNRKHTHREANWLAYNVAHDVELPGAKGPRLEFLMYPQAETAQGRLDCFDPDTFRYTITAREIAA